MPILFIVRRNEDLGSRYCGIRFDKKRFFSYIGECVGSLDSKAFHPLCTHLLLPHEKCSFNLGSVVNVVIHTYIYSSIVL